MKSLKFIFATGLMLCSTLISIQSFSEENLGAGIVLGAPTALTLKYWQTKQVAYDAGLGFSAGNYVLFYGDYLYHYPGAFKQKDAFLSRLTPYVGLGAIVAVTTGDRKDNDNYLGKSSGSFGLGVRVPLGIEWIPREPSLGVFIEIAPGISLIPSTSALLMAGIGVRYYF